MITREDAYCWRVEAARLVEATTTSGQLDKSLVFMDAAERIHVLASVVGTTTHGKDLLGITTIIDEEWVHGFTPFNWKQLIPSGLRSLARGFKQTPSSYLAFFRHKVHALITNLYR